MHHEAQPPQLPEGEALKVAQLNEAYRLFAQREGWTVTQTYFRTHYRGCWRSLEDYGRQLVSDLALDREVLADVPDWLTPYISFDYQRFAAEDLKRDYVTIEGLTGLHVFEPFADPHEAGVVSTTSVA